MQTTHIGRRLSLAMMFVVGLIIIGFAGALIVEQQQSLERELAKRVAIIAELAERTLPLLMWNIDNQNLTEFLEALLTDPAIVYAEYQMEGSIALAAKTNVRIRPDFALQPWTFFEDSPQFLARKITISYQGQRLGLVRFAVSKASIAGDLRDRLVTIGLEMLLLMLAISLTSLAITNRWVIHPLQTLQSSADRLAQGQLEEPIDTSRRDELGHLAHSFAAMRDAIRKMIGDLSRANEELSQEIEERAAIETELRRHKEHLEELVQERTTELRVMNAQLVQEIAERQQIEEALQSAKEEAEAANRAKSAFLANMSHELRTPLNAILGFGQLMARNPMIPREEGEHLAIIQRSGDHLLTLISNILDLSKIEAGQVPFNESAFDLYNLLTIVRDLFTLRAQEKGIELRVERTEDVPHYIRSDEVKLRQVLINLLNNAIKFTQKGQVSLRVSELTELTELPETPQLPNSLTPQLLFEISDTGSGIAPEEMSRLFQPFSQTEAGRQAQEGTGLGLLISQRFVHLLGGEITAASQPGWGSTFTFTIRVGMVDAETVAAPSAPRRVIELEPGQPRQRILVVDDTLENRQLLSELLQIVGFDVRSATNGQEAIDLWKQWQPHLIWMDLRMPVMGGYEATQQIRKAEEQKSRRAEGGGQEAEGETPHTTHHTSRTIIIALSASSLEDERAAALAHGCDDFLRKPFRDHEIFDLLQQHLGVRFVYADDQHAPGATARITLTAESLAVLPDDVRRELRNAVERLDMEIALRVIARIRPQHEALAEALAEQVKQYRFDTLQRSFEEGE